MDDIKDKWPKTITVDKRIVDILSTSTYKNFPRALKEIITNSYDADALSVTVKIDVENEIIVIEDNGKGMDAVDFGFYLRIAAQRRRKNENTTKLGRKIIGQFGVGFLSVFPFFKSYSIESKKAGLSKVLYADIPLAKYFDSETSSLDVGSILINGGEKVNLNDKTKSYTKITLRGFNDHTRSFFEDTETISKYEVATFEGLDKLKWTLSDDLPLPFKDKKFNDIFNYPAYPPFSVTVNGDPLYRGIFGTEILDKHSGESQSLGNIKFKYFIATPGHAVQPLEGRFMKIRNLNVGVGDDRTDFSERRGGNRSRMNWLTGEVHIIEGMNELIKVSRDDFNFSADYEKLKDFFNEKLNQLSNRLENEANFKKVVRQTGEDFRVQNVSLLNPDVLEKKLKKFQSEGYNVRHAEENDISKPVSFDEQKKEIVLDSDIAHFEKSIIIGSLRYTVRSDNWDFTNSLFPACKLLNNEIIINERYPLFKGLKYTDVFVKLHLMLLFNHQNQIIDDAVLRKFNEDILTFYSTYTR